MRSFWIVFRGAEFPLGQRENVVGRSSECDVLLADPSVSRRHASIRIESGRSFLKDLESRFGTIVNGTKITEEVRITPGDSIVFGRVAVQFVSDLHEAEPWRGPRLLYAGEPEVTTNTDSSPSEHIRRMIMRSLEHKRPMQQSWLIRKAIDRAADEWSESTQPDATEADRLAAAADLVASWHTDGSLDEWRKELDQRLRRRRR